MLTRTQFVVLFKCNNDRDMDNFVITISDPNADTDEDGVINYYYNHYLGYISSKEPEETIESDNAGIILLAVTLLIMAVLIIVFISRKQKN